ncbi:PD-(D/E)XK nuclease-like domain-containing protein [uncultured Jatrophihabitans sp.]|uniref:PD-(D/E)XK nuclease-like domain-containing protein n=1 Tax=uncultured Jatrophihabitans sp. TaxID=1610747 RepID=UPI0035C99B5F
MTAAALPTEQITAPGVYPDLGLEDYHAHADWLSSTGARKLLPPSCPALFRWEQDNPPGPKDVFDVGHAAHDMVLGGGPEIVRIEAVNWLTKAAKQQRDEVRARGAVPVLAATHDEVKAMAESVMAHPVAGRLLEHGTGQPETSLFWFDETSGVKRRARLDWLPSQSGRRLIVPDLKSCISAQRDEFAKAAARHGYPAQAAYYLDGVHALGLAEHAVFVFVAVEKTPPYLVNVIQLDVTAMRIGAAMNRTAIDTFADCTRTGTWPGYADDVEIASMPVWFERAHEQELTS